MKYLIIVLFIAGCGGEYKEDWQIDKEFCEAQGGQAQLLDVVNVDTGERRYEIECVFEKSPKRVFCKPDNGFGSECPN